MSGDDKLRDYCAEDAAVTAGLAFLLQDVARVDRPCVGCGALMRTSRKTPQCSDCLYPKARRRRCLAVGWPPGTGIRAGGSGR